MRSLMPVGSVLRPGTAVLAGLTALVAFPLAGSQGQPQLAARVASRAITITLIATGKDGAPVADLRSDEIRLTDSGKQQSITAFQKVRADAAVTTPRQPGVYYAIVFDLLNTTYAHQDYVRLELLRILGELGAGDRTYVLLLRNGLRVLHEPGGERASLLRKFAPQFGAQAVGASPDVQAFSWVFDGMGLANLFTAYGAIQSRRNADTLAAMRTLAASMASLPGRKNLLWVGTGLMTSGGRVSNLMAGRGGMATGGQPNTLVDESDNLSDGDVRDVLNKEIKVTGQVLNDAGMAVYAIDARPLSVDNTVASDANSMKEIARLTGGVAYPDRKDVRSSVRAALDDSREVYMLTFTPTPLKEDGRFHEIKLRTTRANVKLNCREGYTAPAAQPR